MSADRLSTTQQITLKSEVFDNDLTSGARTTRIYTGSKALVVSQQNIEVAFGASMTKVESTGDGNYQLTAGYNYDVRNGGGAASTPTINSHELDISMNQVKVWDNNKVRAAFLAAFGNDWAAANHAMGYLVKRIQAFQEGGDGTLTAQNVAESVIAGDYPAQVNFLLNYFRGVAYHQVEHTMQFDTVYKRRITAASYNQVQASFVGAGKIWTTAEILAFENVPASWWFQLPSTYLWLKAPPIVNTVMQQKTEISYSYLAVVEAWGALYDAYGAATLLNF